MTVIAIVMIAIIIIIIIIILVVVIRLVIQVEPCGRRCFVTQGASSTRTESEHGSAQPNNNIYQHKITYIAL